MTHNQNASELPDDALGMNGFYISDIHLGGPAEGGRTATRGMPRALIVDADAAAMRILRITLANIADCFFAESGDEAFELAHRILPDVILLDADMPNVDAFAACESLRTDPSLTDVPIVFVSRACDQLNRIRALDRGATDVISKPYLRAVLRAHVSKLVQSKRCGDAIREDRRKAIASMSSD